jgi:hypothetical protein
MPEHVGARSDQHRRLGRPVLPERRAWRDAPPSAVSLPGAALGESGIARALRSGLAIEQGESWCAAFSPSGKPLACRLNALVIRNNNLQNAIAKNAWVGQEEMHASARHGGSRLRRLDPD